jgi:perosamine synthetase
MRPRSTTKKVPLSRANIQAAEKRAVRAVLESGWLTHGDRNTAFEGAFASYIGSKYAISLNSCTSALFLALKANDISGEVILPSFTFVASANAVVTAGATPVFADVDYQTCMLDPAMVERAITPKTQAVMLVHFGGQAGPLKEIQKLCKKHGLLLIEDSAEAIGSEYEGSKTGSFGIGCFSFFPTKNITTGEGGMLTTNDTRLAQKIRTLAAHGIDKKRDAGTVSGYRSARYAGYNFRLSNILAAIGLEQMKKVDILNKKRQRAAALYNKLLTKIPEVSVPITVPGRTHVYQMYTIKVPAKYRNELLRTLEDSSIEASVHFIPPVHRQLFYKRKYRPRIPLRNTDRLCREILTLPMYPDLQLHDVRRICTFIERFFASKRHV